MRVSLGSDDIDDDDAFLYGKAFSASFVQIVPRHRSAVRQRLQYGRKQ